MLTTLILAVIGCASGSGNEAIVPDVVDPDGHLASAPDPSLTDGRWGCWGVYDMVIARDGLSWSIAPNRTAETYWGYHLNAVKLLEVS